MDKFELVSEFKPQGDQPQAIQTLVDGIKNSLNSLQSCAARVLL